MCVPSDRPDPPAKLDPGDQVCPVPELPEGDPRSVDHLCDWLLCAGSPSVVAGGGDKRGVLEDAIERLERLARQLASTTKEGEPDG